MSRQGSYFQARGEGDLALDEGSRKPWEPRLLGQTHRGELSLEGGRTMEGLDCPFSV